MESRPNDLNSRRDLWLYDDDHSQGGIINDDGDFVPIDDVDSDIEYDSVDNLARPTLTPEEASRIIERSTNLLYIQQLRKQESQPPVDAQRGVGQVAVATAELVKSAQSVYSESGTAYDQTGQVAGYWGNSTHLPDRPRLDNSTALGRSVRRNELLSQITVAEQAERAVQVELDELRNSEQFQRECDEYDAELDRQNENNPRSVELTPALVQEMRYNRRLREIRSELHQYQAELASLQEPQSPTESDSATDK